jgi:hypothetical protein
MTSHTGCRKFDTFISATKRSLTPLRHPVIAVDLVLFARGIARRTAGRHNINAITSTHTHIGSRRAHDAFSLREEERSGPWLFMTPLTRDLKVKIILLSRAKK